MKIVADANIPFIKEYFGSYGELVLVPGRSISSSDVKDADILLVRSITHVNEKLLAHSKVRFVGSVTAGADHLDTKWLDQAGIVWRVAVGFNAPPVADYVISVNAAMQNRQLLARDQFKAAIIGVGNVGRLVAEKLSFLNANLVLCDPLRAMVEADFPNVQLDDLSDLDLISLHVPLTTIGEYPTYHFISKDFLQRQKPGCILLNASRGAVIDSSGLVKHGAHLHWCFDVWEHEPKIDKAVLERALIATPHIAGYSVQSKTRGIDMIYHLAAEAGMIEEQPISPITIPHQQLSFSGESHGWQDIVLGVFNPMVVTAMMRTLLLPAHEYGPLFDEMRNHFNYRHEFRYSRIVDAKLTEQDRLLLQRFGLRM